MSDFNSRIKYLLEKSYLTQERFCENIGIGTDTLWKILKGERTKVHAETLMKISTQCNVSADWLLFGEDLKSDLTEVLKIKNNMKDTTFDLFSMGEEKSDETLNDRLYYLWASSGLSQTEFSEKAGITMKNLQRIIYHKTNLNSDALIKLCTTYNVSADYILFGKIK